jgi:hypothetical protein
MRVIMGLCVCPYTITSACGYAATSASGVGDTELVPVRHHHLDAANEHVEPLMQIGAPRRIGVAEHGAHRRDGAELHEHIAAIGGEAHVTGVQDFAHAGERREHFGAHEAVRVGDQADGDRFFAASFERYWRHVSSPPQRLPMV